MEHWNKCDICGRYIKFADFIKGKALRRFYLNYNGGEEYETLCPKHNKKENRLNG